MTSEVDRYIDEFEIVYDYVKGLTGSTLVGQHWDMTEPSDLKDLAKFLHTHAVAVGELLSQHRADHD